MSAPHRAATVLCAATLLGCSPDSGSDVLAPSDVLTPRLAASGAAIVPVYNFSVDTLGVRLNAVNTQDMYLSTRQPDGSWGPIANIGPTFNTTKDDRCADFAVGAGQGAMRRDEAAGTHAKGNVVYAVYASTDRPGGRGNRDLWYFRLDDLLRSEQE